MPLLIIFAVDSCSVRKVLARRNGDVQTQGPAESLAAVSMFGEWSNYFICLCSGISEFLGQATFYRAHCEIFLEMISIIGQIPVNSVLPLTFKRVICCCFVPSPPKKNHSKNCGLGRFFKNPSMPFLVINACPWFCNSVVCVAL